MNFSFSEFFAHRIPIIFDGALGTQIQKANLKSTDYAGHEGCNEILNVLHPDVIRKIHEEYLQAGANVVETNTFGANRAKLREYKLENRVSEINRAGAVVARDAVAGCVTCDRPLFVCGSIGPTGYLPSSSDPALSAVSFDELAEMYKEQAAGLLDGGVDLLLLETIQDLLEVRAALYGIRALFRDVGRSVPLQVQVTMDAAGRTLLGSDCMAFLGSVSSLGPDCIGLNCGTGPAEMIPAIRTLLELSSIPVSMMPNAGMPENIDGKAVYRMLPSDFADMMAPLVIENGLHVAGGCCGTTPGHIRALAERLKGHSVAERNTNRIHCLLSTGINGIDLESLARPMIIGERLNAQGSKKTKELILARNFDELYQIGSEQALHKSALLDLCVAVNERDDESEMMTSLVRFLSDRIASPFCIDSTEPPVMESALKACPGPALLNSINLEHGGKKARQILALARDFGCPAIALTIDDEGMAKSVDRKVALARMIRDLACEEFGLPEHFVYIDPLVFTLATGDAESADAARNSLEAIRRIKREMPGVRTIMGVSNVSYGLKPKARRILNNCMLSQAVSAGLDAAIFNPMHVEQIETYDEPVRKAALALLQGNDAGALGAFITLFEQGTDENVSKVPSRLSAEKETMAPAERLRASVLNRDRRDLEKAIKIALDQMPAIEILNSVLLPAMAEVGERMAAGTMILPFVLQAAEVMKEAVNVLEPYLKESSGSKKGKIILATVYGDVHDIGKNLVGSILRNQGYEVIDLGKQVPVETIVEAVRREAPDAIGLSALLVTTSRQMAECIKDLDRQNIRIPVLIGGAAVNIDFASRIAQLETGPYAGGVYYARDAFEASKLLESFKEKSAQNGSTVSAKQSDSIRDGEQSPCIAPEPIQHGPHIEPPFHGTSDILVWDPEQLLKSIDKTRLFKAWWGGGKLDEDGYRRAEQEEFLPSLSKLQALILSEDLLDPRGFYGFFPSITDDNLVIVLDPADFLTELTSFSFPRVARKKGRSVADYFRPEGDLFITQIVTIGGRLSDRCREYFHKEERYSLGYFLNGIGNYMVELLADRLTGEITRGLGLPLGSGRRYSFGYPGTPPLEEQKKLFDLMSVEDRLGVTLTTGYQMVPEHSTMGVYVHYPESEYL